MKTGVAATWTQLMLNKRGYFFFLFLKIFIFSYYTACKHGMQKIYNIYKNWQLDIYTYYMSIEYGFNQRSSTLKRLQWNHMHV